MVFRATILRIRNLLVSQRRRLSNAGTLGGASVIAAFASLIALALNTRGLGAADFGVLVAIQAYVALCATICTMETWQSVCRLAAEDGADMRAICRKTLTLDLLAAVAAFLLAVLGLQLFGAATGLDERYKVLAMVYSLSLLLGVTGTPRGFFRFRDGFDVLAANLIFNAVLLLATSFLLWAYESPLEHYVYAFTVVAVLAKLQLMARFYLRFRKLAPAADAPPLTFGRVARMSLAVSLLSTIMNSRKNLAIMAAGGFLGAAGAGLVGAAFRCTTILSRVTETLKQLLFSDTVKAFARPETSSGAVRKLRGASLALLGFLLVGAATFALFADLIVELVLGPDFADAAPVLGALLLAEGLYLATVMFIPVFQVRGRTNLLSAIHAGVLASFFAALVIVEAEMTPLLFALCYTVPLIFAYAAQYWLVLGPKGIIRNGAGT